MGVFDFSRPALGKLAIRAEDAGRCEPPNAEKGYAVRCDFRGFHGSHIRGKVPGAGTPRHSLVTVRRGDARALLPVVAPRCLPPCIFGVGFFRYNVNGSSCSLPSVRPRLIGFLPVGRFSFAARRYACVAF